MLTSLFSSAGNSGRWHDRICSNAKSARRDAGTVIQSSQIPHGTAWSGDACDTSADDAALASADLFLLKSAPQCVHFLQKRLPSTGSRSRSSVSACFGENNGEHSTSSGERSSLPGSSKASESPSQVSGVVQTIQNASASAGSRCAERPRSKLNSSMLRA